jgi:hypothetical protein
MIEPGTLRHFIDGFIVEEPQGWDEFTQTLDRDERTRIIGVQYPIDLTFVGGAYELLNGYYIADGCAELDYRCDVYFEGSWQEACIGKIFLGDIEWDLSRAQAKVSITDDSVGARIVNNRKVIVFPDATVSKTGQVISAVNKIDLRVFEPTDPIGTYLPDTRVVYDWLEAMTHLVQYLSDSSVSVVSDWYDALPDDELWAVTNGYELRQYNDNQRLTKYTWDTIFLPFARLFNLWAGVERDIDGAPVIRIEPDSYWKGTQVAASFPFTDGLTRKVDQDQLFAKVIIGSGEAIKDVSSTYSLPFLFLRGFTSEDITLKTACNTDAELDLSVDEFIVDSNRIEAAINGNDDKDDSIFLIQYDVGGPSAKQSQYLFPGSSPCLYNEQALNINVLNRYALPSDPILNFGSATLDAFQAERTITGTPQTFTTGLANWTFSIPADRVRFDDDYTSPNFDNSNSYGNGTVQGNPVSNANSRYTAAAQGYATFTVFMPFECTANGYASAGFDPTSWSTFGANMGFVHRDSGGGFIQSVRRVLDAGTEESGLGTFSILWTFGVSMNAGDYIEIYAGFDAESPVPLPPGNSSLTLNFLNRAIFRSVFTTTGGGIITSVDPDLFYGTLYDFDRHITQEQWNDLRSDQSQRIQVGPDGVTVFGYVKNAERNIRTQQTKWTLIANRAQV